MRSACHAASEAALPWLEKVRRAIYVGTPHVGAPAERMGRLLAKVLHAIPDPYTRLIGDIGDLRSAGVKDLGDADLRHQDRASLSDRLSLRDPHHPVPLLPGVKHALVAGSLAMEPGVASLFGDAIVPVASATARGLVEAGSLDLPAERVRVLPGRSHLDLPHDAEVYEFIKEICEQPP